MVVNITWKIFSDQICSFSRNLADLKDFVASMKEVAAGGDKAPAEKVPEEKAEVFTVTLDVDTFKDGIKEGSRVVFESWELFSK